MTLSTITNYLTSIGCEFPGIALLQPADPFLDTTGEDLRRRIFITQENSGALLCLRPEFTVPVCISHLENGSTSGRYAYGGSVFRQRSDDTSEFLQAGFEDLGDKDKNAADISCIKTALNVLQAIGEPDGKLVLGNQAIFLDLLEALTVPPSWRKKLVRSFGDARLLKEAVALISSSESEAMPDMPQSVRDGLEAGDLEKLTAVIKSLMLEDGLQLNAGRTPSAIAERLLEKHQLSAVHLEDEKRKILETYLNLDMPLVKAPDALRSFAHDAGIDLTEGVSTIDALTEGLSRSLGSATFRASFGRRLDYYTGLVFEVYRNGLDKPLIGGGRYDRLLTLLGAETEIPAVGFAIWVDRLESGK